MHHFTYQKALTLDQVVSQTLKSSGGKAALLAGGTDLLVQIKESKISPETIIDLKTIQSLNDIETRGNQIIIGALTTIRTLEISEIVRNKLPLLAQAASKLGSVQVRNRATIGGNICNAAPSAETAPALLALEAKAQIIGLAGEREIELQDFFTGPSQTTLAQGEILKSIKINLSHRPQGAIYYKLANRKAMDIAFVGVAVLVELAGETIAKARIALGAVAPTPIRVPQAEELLLGKSLTPELALKAAQIAAETSQPITDLRASKEYRREMVKNLCHQGLLAAYAQAGK